MEQIIGKLSEIETTAETIMKDALQKKKALSAEMDRQSKEFDTQLEKHTEEQIQELAKKCSFMGKRTVGTFKVLQIPDMEAIYKMAR